MKRFLGAVLLAFLPATAWGQGSIPPVNNSVVYATGGAWGTSTAPALTGLTLTGLGGGGSRCVTVDNGGVFGATACGGGGGGGITSLSQGSGITLSPNPITSTGTVICTAFSNSLVGCVPASGGGTTNFLRADGAWAAPPGGGGSISGLTAGQVGIAGSATTLTSSLPLSGTSGATQIATATSASKTAGHQAVYDANGNLIDGGAPGSGGTVTSITCGTGLSGGTITTTGTCAMPNTGPGAGSFTNANVTLDAQGRVTAASSGSAGSAGAIFNATFAGSASHYTATAAGFTLSAGNGVIGPVAIESATGADLAVNGGPAKPFAFNTGVGNAAVGAGGIHNPQILFAIYDGANFVLQSAPFSGPPITVSDTVTAGKWNTNQSYAISTAGQTITLPVATSLPMGGSITIQPIGVTVAVQPNGADGINGGSIGTPITLPVGITTILTTSGASGLNAFQVPAGPAQYKETGWLPGANLVTSGSSATNGVFMGRTATARTVYGVKCSVPIAAGGAATFDIYATANGSAPNAGLKLNTTACNANVAANTEQDMGINTTQIPANYLFWLVATAWPTGTTSLSSGGAAVTIR